MPNAVPQPLTRAVLVGVTGRMGRALLKEADGFAALVVTGAIVSADSLAVGRDTAELTGAPSTNLRITADLPQALSQADVVLDFSAGSAVAATLGACRAARKPLVLGTTGYPAALSGELEAAAREIALLVAANTSVAVAVLEELTRRAAAALPEAFDIDILDLHHRTKRDAPSGTALALGRAAASGRGVPAPKGSVAAPAAERPPGEIRFAAVRAGDAVGEHTVRFGGPGEELVLRHRAQERAVFARGALAAALWLARQPPGRYGMRDFLGFKTEA